MLCCCIALRPQGPRPGSQKDLSGRASCRGAPPRPAARGAGFPFSPWALARSALRAPRPGFARRCLAAPGARGAVSHRSCGGGVWGFARRSWEGSFCSSTKTSARAAGPPARQPREAGMKEPSRRTLATCHRRQPSLLPKARGETVWGLRLCRPRPCPRGGREYRAPGSSGGERLAGDPVLAGACFLSPLTKSCSPSATDRLSRLKQIKGRIPLFQGGREALNALTRFARFTGSG